MLRFFKLGSTSSIPSSSGGSTKPSTKSSKKQDHYEVLGISSNATAEEIKKAYRKQALINHPDKNPLDIVNATKKFATILSAYEILSDEQEKAWFDDHRDILDDPGFSNEEEESYFNDLRNGGKVEKDSRGIKVEQLMRFFTTQAWTGFEDSPDGFYKTFSTLFNLIAASEPLRYPSFQTSTTSYALEVKNFYSTWLHFSSEKDFAWKDCYRYEAGMDRNIRRQVDKENLKERLIGKREFNECVRSLVMFVRKRDPRYIASLSNLSTEQLKLSQQAKIKADLLLAAKERAAAQAIEAANYVAQDWEKDTRKEEINLEWEERSEEELEEGEQVGNWCVACQRGFSSGGVWEDHERSRKHAKNLERLIKEMQEEEELLGLNDLQKASETKTKNNDQVDENDHDSEEEEEEIIEIKKKSKKVKKGKKGFSNAFDLDQLEDDIGEIDRSIAKESATPLDSPSLESESTDKPIPPREEDNLVSNQRPIKKSRRKAKDSTPTSGTSTPINDITPSTPTDSIAGSILGEAVNEGRELSKKDKRRAKELAKSTIVDPALRCNVCDQNFPSRSKLFIHIEETGHALAANHGNDDAQKVKGKGKKGNKR